MPDLVNWFDKENCFEFEKNSDCVNKLDLEKKVDLENWPDFENNSDLVKWLDPENSFEFVKWSDTENPFEAVNSWVGVGVLILDAVKSLEGENHLILRTSKMERTTQIQ